MSLNLSPVPSHMLPIRWQVLHHHCVCMCVIQEGWAVLGEVFGWLLCRSSQTLREVRTCAREKFGCCQGETDGWTVWSAPYRPVSQSENRRRVSLWSVMCCRWLLLSLLMPWSMILKKTFWSSFTLHPVHTARNWSLFTDSWPTRYMQHTHHLHHFVVIKMFRNHQNTSDSLPLPPQLSPETNMVVAQMNAADNDVPLGYDVQGWGHSSCVCRVWLGQRDAGLHCLFVCRFPTIYFVPAGRKDEPIRYEVELSCASSTRTLTTRLISLLIF